MAQYGFYVNTDICVGCKACMTSCFDRNNLEVPQKFRKVYEYGGGEWMADDKGAFTTTAFTYYVSMTCGHCDKPACVEKCPTGAMAKDKETGIVNNDKEKCIGCMTCQIACPYGHPVKLEDGLSHKCDACMDDLVDGKPVCVRSCPVRALDFGDIKELRAKYGEVNTMGDLPSETGPNVVFSVHRDAAKGGTLRNEVEVLCELSDVLRL